jgi:hypothetical protein
MPDRKTGRVYDLARRSAERARENAEGGRKALAGDDVRRADALALSSAINEHYGQIFPDQFDQSLHGSTVTVTKKAGGSALKIDVLGDDKFKLSGGSGPAGFNADLAVSMSEASLEEMEDTLEDWFNISTT